MDTRLTRFLHRVGTGGNPRLSFGRAGSKKRSMSLIRFLVFRFALGLLILSVVAPQVAANEEDAFDVLVFSKTAGFRHGSIEAGIAAIEKLGKENGFKVEATEEAGAFEAKNLERFEVVVFLNTTGTVFNEAQRDALQHFIRSGGGFVGIHAAADTEYDWPWYGQLVGAYFKSHPRIQKAVIEVEDREHAATRHLPAKWERTDEWYSFRANPRKKVNVLMALDPDSFEGGEMGEDHPIGWYHEFEGGRAFYTGLGHTSESYTEEAFLAHLTGAISWAAGADLVKKD